MNDNSSVVAGNLEPGRLCRKARRAPRGRAVDHRQWKGRPRTTIHTRKLDSQKASMTAVNAVTGNQTTTWAHGTTLADSGVARNDLLRFTTYPDGTVGWSTLGVADWADLTVDQWADMTVDPVDTTQLTYNRLGEKRTFEDQRGTVHTYFRDKLGREINDCVTTVGADTDATVLQIATAFEPRGMAATITSTDSATPGSGTILNQCALTYNSFAQLTLEQQSHSGAVTNSTPAVGYVYDSGAGGSNDIRFTGLIYPNGRPLTYNFASGMDSTLNRVTSISDPSATLASYTYLGLGTVVRIAYPQPSIWLDLWGGTSGVFAGLDLFNRVIDQRWQNNIGGTPADIDRYKYGHDQNSNRQWKANVVGTANVAAGLDEYYTNDNLNRLTDMQRGVLNGTNTGISGTPAREMNYTLDPTGNWPTYLTKTNGATDLNQGRTSNPVNEITNITESGGTPLWVTPAYDAAGNMTTMPKPGTPTSSFTAVYDAWKRMTAISASGSAIGQYQYDGRHRQIISMTSETQHFFFTNAWQDVEQRVGTAATMDQQHVWGIRFINELVCRDDATPQRLYVGQDANFNVTFICSASGSVQERFLYDPYGTFATLDGFWSTAAESSDWAYFLQGGHFDAATGLYLSRHRVCSPIISLWLQRDPAGYLDWANLYQAFASNPVTLTDPAGLQALSRPTTQPATQPATTQATTGPSVDLNGIIAELNDPVWQNRRKAMNELEADLQRDPAILNEVLRLRGGPRISPEVGLLIDRATKPYRIKALKDQLRQLEARAQACRDERGRLMQTPGWPSDPTIKDEVNQTMSQQEQLLRDERQIKQEILGLGGSIDQPFPAPDSPGVGT